METRNYIGGNWREAEDARTYPTFNPTTGEILAQVARSSNVDVDDAMAAARDAFPAWKATPAPLRGNLLFQVANVAQAREDELAQLISQQHGKTLEDAHGDIQELIHVALYWAGEGRRQYGSIIPSEKRAKVGFSRREPLGVVVALTPWNFAVTKPALKIFAALIFGNTVVHKPAHETPLIGTMVQELMNEAGIPPGVVNTVLGYSSDIGDALVEHPDVGLITYTGTTPVGRTIAARAGARLTPVSLELNAKNALIVNADANLELALDWAVLSAFATNGQRETAASRIILHRDIADEFIAGFLDRADRLKVGDPLDPATRLGPLISAQQQTDIEDYVQRAIAAGGRVLRGAKRPDDPNLSGGYFYLPTVLADVDPRSELAMEEVLGPVTMFTVVDNLDEAIEIANATPYGLSMSIFTSNIETGLATADRLETGVAWINAGTVGAEVGLPFGGAKATGIGTTEWGQGAVDTFTRWKTTYINYGSSLRMVWEDTRLQVGASGANPS